jgi:hypothetical protein
MYPSIKAVTSTMLTAVSSAAREPTTWTDATSEFAKVVNFWNAVSSAVDPLHILKSFDDRPFRTPLLEPDVMSDSIQNLKTLLASNEVTPQVLFFLRKTCHSACNIDPVSRGIGVQN